MYQLLKYEFASGPWNIVGALIMPGIAIGALMLVPFMDTSKERRPFKRPLPTAFMLLAFASLIYLTYESYINHDWEQQEIKWCNSGKKSYSMLNLKDIRFTLEHLVLVVTGIHSKVDLVYRLPTLA